ALVKNVNEENAPSLLVGNGQDQTHLLVVISSDRGLCGGFNSAIVRDVHARIRSLEQQSKNIKLLVVGRKAVVQLRRQYQNYFIDAFEDLCKPVPLFTHGEQIAEKIQTLFAENQFDVCTVIYNRFVSALTQIVTPLSLIPFKGSIEQDTAPQDQETNAKGDPLNGAVYQFEPDEHEVLSQILPRNISVQLYRSLLESFASEQGARMAAMDNATRNAGEMIDRLQITYNRTRQAQITKELIEIISGAEAL
ncbi:MAG: ATP synthase F1 subunit gamma, partial [Pseudomonadota bacterium]